MNPGHVAMALYGLQAQEPSPEVDDVLSALAPKPQEVGMALYGFRRLDGSPAALSVLGHLPALI
eukprot:gene39813-28430_t